MTREELLKLFEEIGVLQTGHFHLTSGLHSEQYMQCAALFEDPHTAARVIKVLIEKLPDGIDTVVAPAIGAINMGYEVARALGCRFIFAERENGLMTLRRGFALKPEERVLIVEDVVTTGGSVKEVVKIVTESGCDLKAVAAIVDRSQGKVDFGAPFIPLLAVNIETYRPDNCPLCALNKPTTKPGSRDK